MDKAAETQEDLRLTVSGRFDIMIDVKFEWTFPDSVIFLPHSYLVIVVWLFCCPYLGSVGRMEDYINMENDFLSLIKKHRSVRSIKRNLYLCRAEGKYADQQ